MSMGLEGGCYIFYRENTRLHSACHEPSGPLLKNQARIQKIITNHLQTCSTTYSRCTVPRPLVSVIDRQQSFSQTSPLPHCLCDTGPYSYGPYRTSSYGGCLLPPGHADVIYLIGTTHGGGGIVQFLIHNMLLITRRLDPLARCPS